ncbi:Alpha-(1,6)-fucosyltransferase [Nymphon striatum]|nr:Alpha-(1,6)-fucosyltransferase [Nymphon striatum]
MKGPKRYPNGGPLLLIPEALKEKVNNLTSNANAWWYGHLAKYMLRLNSTLQTLVDASVDNISKSRPVVGIHIRHTDKRTEAQLYDLHLYLGEVDKYFDNLNNSKNKTFERRVYMATDDFNVWKEAKNHSSRFRFLGNSSFSTSASLDQRYSVNSAKEMVIDLLSLLACDHIVCTFSSNVCRLLYELKATTEPNVTYVLSSLDSKYHYPGHFKNIMQLNEVDKNRHNKTAVFYITSKKPKVKKNVNKLIVKKPTIQS